MDSQIVEIMGRNYLVNQLYQAGIEVARPERDKGIDLIAYIDTDTAFYAVPIQMKAASVRRFSIDKKYEKFPALLLVNIWNLATDIEVEVYATTYQQALAIANEMGWTKTPSWEKGNYTSAISKNLQELLNPYRMQPELWQRRLRLE